MKRQDVIPVLSAEQMRALDQATIEQDGVPSMVLMERAGQGAANAILARYPHAKRVAIVCGKGNNGGDGLVVARHLHEVGLEVQAQLAFSESEMKGDALQQVQIARAYGVPVLESPLDYVNSDLIVDALLGTGATGAPREPVTSLIQQMNDSGVPVVALDIPSGIDADTGNAAGKRIEAELTLTMGLPKQGFFQSDAVRALGEWQSVDIGFSRKRIESLEVEYALLTESFVEASLPKFKPDDHKGSRGHVLVVGGTTGMAGAPALTGIAALRMGAGLATVAIPERVQPQTAGFYPELITLPLPDNGEGVLTSQGVALLKRGLDRFDTLAIGMGLSLSSEVGMAFQTLLEAWLKTGKPCLIDADGLNWLARLPISGALNEQVILTPHPGEAARLLGVSTSDIQEARLQSAPLLRERYRCHALLKGAYTLIAHSRGIWINPFAEPSLGTAGSGDSLSGMIVGLMAQGLKPDLAAACAAYRHAQTAVRLKERGNFTASELSSAP